MKILITIIIFLLHSIVFSHEGQDERIEFWKNYYNPKLEVQQEKIPEIDIKLHKIGPFFQLQTIVKNFTLTPDQDLKNDNTWTGYGKLFINGEYVTRIYNEFLFIRDMPVGNNEIRVVLSSNMDKDIAYKNNLIDDLISYRFPEYNFAEARSKAYNLSIQCEFSEEGIARREKLSLQGMTVFESSKYYTCRQNSQKPLVPFKEEMSKAQLAHFEAVMSSIAKRITLWKKYEENNISLSKARQEDEIIEDSIDIEMRKKLNLPPIN